MDLLSKHGFGVGKYKIGDYIELASIGISPTTLNMPASQGTSFDVDNAGNVYYGGYRNGLRKVDKNKNLVWTYPYSTTQAMETVKLSSDGFIYFSGDTKELFKINTDGTLAWSVSVALSSIGYGLYNMASDMSGNIWNSK